MEFKFSKKEELLQWAVNDFAERELIAKEKELNTLEYVPTDILKKIGELGYLGLRIPEKYGGKPGTWVMIGTLIEEMAKANAAIAHLIMLSYEISLSLANYGTEEANEEWLSNLIKGNKLGCTSLTESDSGSDITALKTRASRNQNSYTIDGEKSPVSFGKQADIVILFAKSDSEMGDKGITAFLIPLDLPGIAKFPIKNMGLLPSAPVSFKLNQVHIPVKYQMGDEGEGVNIIKSMGFLSDFHRVISGLISLGLAQTALKLAISYSKKRVAFGRPIGKFEAVSGKIAEDATLIEAGRWLCYRALWLKDQELANAKEAAMCGWWCPKVAYQIIENALLIHGHTGYANDLPFQQMLRDAIAFEIIAGTEQILKLVIAQSVIGGMAVPDGLSVDLGYWV